MTELVDLGTLHPRLAGLIRPAHATTPGLSRAIAERFGIDPLLVRIGFVALTWFGGLGIAVYGWGWLLTPKCDQPPILRFLPAFGGWSQQLQWLAIGGSSLVVVLSGSLLNPVSILPVLLAVWLLRSRAAAPSPEVLDSPVPLNQAAAEADPASLPVVDLYAPPEHPLDEIPATPTADPIRRSWWVGLAMALLTLAVWGTLTLVIPSWPAMLTAAVALGVLGLAVTIWGVAMPRHAIPIPILLLACGAALLLGTFATDHVLAEVAQP